MLNSSNGLISLKYGSYFELQAYLFKKDLIKLIGII